jgi:hypothetical protein
VREEIGESNNNKKRLSYIEKRKNSEKMKIEERRRKEK